MGPKGQLANGNSTAAVSEAELSKQAEQDGGGKVVVQYRECQRNHAAGIGGYAVDGCREFLACLPPQDLLCAACGCHRSFHKRELAADSDSGFSSSSAAAAAGR